MSAGTGSGRRQEPPVSKARDRRVHARLVTGAEVVRYERAGKWYLEPPEGKRSLLTVGDAVALACTPLCEVVYGLPGGEAFDRALTQAALAAAEKVSS